MKKLLAITALTLLCTQSFAATVLGARLDASKKYLVVEVRYGGGCGTHDFSLKVGPCLESLPVRCEAELIEKANDPCEALVTGLAVIPLSEAGLDTPYFKKASLTIAGEKDWSSSNPSKATVKLP